MILHRPALFVLSLVITVLLMALTLGVAAGSSHVITDEYIDVEPDGYLDAEVAAGGHQRWRFEITEPRDHNVRIEIEEPPGASLGVRLNGENLGTVNGEGLFPLSLEAGSHTLIIDNPSDVPVKYELYMGFEVNLAITKSDSPDPVFAGDRLIYTITVSNRGSTGFAPSVLDTLPAGVTFVSTSGCSGDPNGVPICGLESIGGNKSVSYTITVDVDPSTFGIITNRASLRSFGGSTSEDTTVHRRSVGGMTSFERGSGSSSGIALLAGGATLIVAIIATSAWCTRRRWLGSRS